MTVLQDAFISYGRAQSKAFARHLSDRLTAAGVSTWLDFDDIPKAVDFQAQIDDGITKSHNFLYVISPSSVNSPYCDKELALALAYGKRIIPIMHVEEISQEVWQQQYPTQTEADWQAFKAAGKHRSEVNLNPTVGKLNWACFREGQDNFEQAFDELLALIAEQPASQRLYTQRHTQLLVQALAWQQNHQQTRYLLVGAERQAAAGWLTTAFETPPCVPTPLHCEFITESTKNANNLMTRVFLCHANEDQASAEQIRQSLLRRGITVWNYRTDIETSQNYHSAISQGIEEADNLIFVLSPHSVESPYCRQELENAVKLQKRIIPVLAAPVTPAQMPESLRALNYLDLTDNLQLEDYWADESQLLKLLNTDVDYYNQHKVWLTQALKWERQQHQPAMLLRGYNLREAETWLKMARTCDHPPTKLHETFIAESLRQPPNASLDVFISYSRVDSDFARRLNESLQIQGKRTWFDQESIATGADFQQEIYRGIESSQVFLFVLSPQSINSPHCAGEVEHAAKHNKRIVTVLYRPIDTGNLHPVLAKVQWLDFRDRQGDFQASFQPLLRTLDTDREHLKSHTRLLSRAIEWNEHQRDDSHLLRGSDLADTEDWLLTNASVEPRPTSLQREYIRISRQQQTIHENTAMRRLRWGALMGTLAAVVGFTVGGSQLVGANQAIAEADQRAVEADQRAAEADDRVAKADKEVESAEQQLRDAEQKTKAAEATEQNARRAAEAARQELEAATAAKLAAEAQLEQVKQESQDRIRLSEQRLEEAERRRVKAAARQQQAETIFEIAQTGSRIERSGSTLLRQLNAVFAASEFANRGVSFSPSSVSPTASRLPSNKQLADGDRTSPLPEDDVVIQDEDFFGSDSPDDFIQDEDFFIDESVEDIPVPAIDESDSIFSSLTLRSILIDAVEISAELKQLMDTHELSVPKEYPATSPVLLLQKVLNKLSPDSLLSSRFTGVEKLSSPGVPLTTVGFSASGEHLATADLDGTIRVLDLRTGKDFNISTGVGGISTLELSSRSHFVAGLDNRGILRLWDYRSGEQIADTERNTELGNLAAFTANPVEQVIALRNNEGNNVRLYRWSLEKANPFEFVGTRIVGRGRAAAMTYSPDGQLVLSDGDGRIFAQNLPAGPISTYQEAPRRIQVSHNLKYIGIQDFYGDVRIWNEAGQQLAEFGREIEDSQGRATLQDISFSPDGHQVAIAYGDGNLRVYDMPTLDRLLQESCNYLLATESRDAVVNVCSSP